MSSDEKERQPGAIHRGPDHSAPYPVSRMAPAIELVDLAREIAEADRMLSATAGARLQVIADQVRALQEEARRILEATRRDQALHRAEARFKRVPGHTYHLYRRPDGRRYFSMLDPGEWGGEPPHAYEGAYRLEHDLSWTPAAETAAPDESREVVERLLAISRREG